MHDITIKNVNQGWIVTVGCQTIVFTDKKKMVKAFKEYMDDPEKARKKYCDNVNSLLQPPIEPRECPNQNSIMVGADGRRLTAEDYARQVVTNCSSVPDRSAERA